MEHEEFGELGVIGGSEARRFRDGLARDAPATGERALGRSHRSISESLPICARLLDNSAPSAKVLW